MDNNTGSKPSAIKTFLGKYYLVLRYIYLLFLIAGAVLGFARLDFIDKSIQNIFILVYYFFFTISIITLFLHNITLPEIIIILCLYPVLMLKSKVPFEVIYYIFLFGILKRNYCNKGKQAIKIYLILVVIVGFFNSTSFSLKYVLLTYNTISRTYSINGEYRIDYCKDFSTAISLYQVYGDTFQRLDRRLYGSGEGTTPTFEWIDNDHVKINESIIDIHSDETYN